MKPPRFSYHDPATLDEAVRLLDELDDAKVLAGGQSLLPMMNMRFVIPDHIIDLNHISGLDEIHTNGEQIYIGAMTRQRALLASSLLQTRCPLMTEALHQVGHRATRNRGTLGGSLCHLDPAAELPVVLAAHDANIQVRSSNGERTIVMQEFPAFYMTPAIEPNEIVMGINFTAWKEGHGYAFLEYARRHGDFAIVAAAVLIELSDDHQVARCSITLGGVGAGPLRLLTAESMFCSSDASDTAADEVAQICREIDTIEDVHASTAYRRHVAETLVARGLKLAMARARQ